MTPPFPTRDVVFAVSADDAAGDRAVSGRLLMPSDDVLPRACLVLAHGAGAGLEHPLMETHAVTLARGGIGTFRYHFPYMEEGRRRPDRPKLLHATVRAAVAQARELCPELLLLAGGRSMGGRMTSQAQAIEALDGVAGIVFLAFPLHPAKKPGIERAAHLAEVEIPMLFVNGTRDGLGDLELLKQVVSKLGKKATLHVVEGADHSFQVLKRSGRTHEEVHDELVAAVVDFTASLSG